MKPRDVLRSGWDDMDWSATPQSLREAVPEQQKPIPPDAVPIDLPDPNDPALGNLSVREAIFRRESHRKYSDAALTISELSFLLYATQGVRKYTPKYSFRAVPSAGCRHSFETYLFIRRVEGLDESLYRYLPLTHQLTLTGRPDPESLNQAMNKQLWNSAVVFIWTAIPFRMEWRYGEESAKLILLDAGHLCQNLYLAAESIDCGVCAIGAYSQRETDAFVGADGEEEFAVYLATVGKG